MQNDERAWRFICRNMKSGFESIIGKAFPFSNFTKEDVDDMFQSRFKVCYNPGKN